MNGWWIAALSIAGLVIGPLVVANIRAGIIRRSWRTDSHPPRDP